MKNTDNDIIDSGCFMPEVVDVDYLGGLKVFLRFQDGKEGSVDFSDMVKEGVWSKLQDSKEFAQFGLEHGTLVWSNNLDVSPEYLYRVVTSDATPH